MTLPPEDIARLKSLMENATPVFGGISVLTDDTSDGKAGDCRVWHKDETGRCIAVFKDFATAVAFVGLCDAAPSLLAAADRCVELEKDRDVLEKLWRDRVAELEAENDELAEYNRDADKARTMLEAESLDLTTRLAAARDGLEKILSGIEPYPGDIARDTLARIGGEA